MYWNDMILNLDVSPFSGYMLLLLTSLDLIHVSKWHEFEWIATQSYLRQTFWSLYVNSHFMFNWHFLYTQLTFLVRLTKILIQKQSTHEKSTFHVSCLLSGEIIKNKIYILWRITFIFVYIKNKFKWTKLNKNTKHDKMNWIHRIWLFS